VETSTRIVDAGKPGAEADQLMPGGSAVPGSGIHGIEEAESVVNAAQLAVHAEQICLSVAMAVVGLGREGFDDVGMEESPLRDGVDVLERAIEGEARDLPCSSSCKRLLPFPCFCFFFLFLFLFFFFFFFYVHVGNNIWAHFVLHIKLHNGF
jgi:hypothetical protein